MEPIVPPLDPPLSYECGEHLCLRWFVSARRIAYEYPIDVTATWIVLNLASPVQIHNGRLAR